MSKVFTMQRLYNFRLTCDGRWKGVDVVVIVYVGGESVMECSELR